MNGHWMRRRRRAYVQVKLFLRAVCGFTTRACEYERRAFPVRSTCGYDLLTHVQLAYHLGNEQCTQPLTARRGVQATLATVRVTCVDATPSPRFQKSEADVASQ
ncbi:hypothetical protein Bbelb_139100 [Branchiostoma belcheri]|nr:hypothetical protein Bbelb_139100 [Branchiostoma belcheri]